MNSLKNNLFKISDSSEGNFVDRYFPNWSVPYLRLSRADRPTGTWLLLLPCWFGILLAYNEKNTSISFYEIWLLIACGLGAFLMRGAGCTWNDILDKKYDAKVERTKNRPIPSGQVTILKAFIWMIVQSLFAFLILLTFNKFSIFNVGSGKKTSLEKILRSLEKKLNKKIFIKKKIINSKELNITWCLKNKIERKLSIKLNNRMEDIINSSIKNFRKNA